MGIFSRIFGDENATVAPSDTSAQKPPQLAREFSAPDLGFQSFGFALAGGSLGSQITGPASNAIRVISDRVSGLTLSVSIVRQVVGEDEITPAPDHPLSLLLADPTGYSGGSAQFSTADTLKILTSQILSTGEGYLLVIKNGLGVPSELWVQAPGSITPIIEAGRVVAYQSNQNGKLQKLDASEVVRIFNPDPANPWAAKSTLADHVMDLETDYFLRQHVRRRFASDAAPRTVLETTDANESLPSPEELQAFNVAWRSSMSSRHGTNSGGISILKPGWSAKSLDGSTDYMHLVEMLQQSERTLLHSFGVPETITGASTSINRATVEASQHIFDTYAVQPLTVKVAQALTDQLGRLYPSSEGARLLVTFDSFVEPDRAAQLSEDVADAGAGIRSINEIRSDRGYQDADSEWGGLPIQPASNRPFNGEEPPQPAMSSGMDYRGERQDGVPWDSLETVKKRFSPAAEFRTARRRELVWMSPVEKTVRSLWAGEKTQIMKNFNALPFEVWPYEDTGKRASSDDLPNAAEAERVAAMIATPTLEDAERYNKKLGKLFTRIYETSAEETTEFLASAKPFKMTTKAAEAIKLETASLYRYDTGTTVGDIVKSLSKSITEGKGSKAAARDLSKALSDRMDQASAKRIAATEIASVTNAARLDSFAQSDSVEGTRWMNSMDMAVRPSHLIEGQFAPLGGKFTLGSGEQARYPGDPSLSAADRINCRCAAIPTFKQNLDDNWAAKSQQAASEVDPKAAIGFDKATSKTVPAEN